MCYAVGMFRFVSFVILCALVIGPAVAEAERHCDLRSVWRGDRTASYVPKAQACLVQPTEGFWYDERAEAEILALINATRAEVGLPGLISRPGLLAPARLHSLDMAKEDFVEHEGPDGRSVLQRVQALDRTLIFSEVRENLAAVGGGLDYAETARLLHRILFDSEGHKTNLLAPNVTHVGIGLVRAEEGAWVTEVFVRQEGELSRALPLELEGGALADIDAALIDWDFGEFRIRTDEGDEYGLDEQGAGESGDAALLVVGEKITETPEKITRQLIKLRGPLMSPARPPRSGLLEQERRPAIPVEALD